MNINRILGRSLVISIAASAILSSCSKFEKLDFQTDQPTSIERQNILNAYKDLKAYVDYTSQASFKLGAELSMEDITGNSLLYRLAQRNFDEINLSTIQHKNFVQADGVPTVGTIERFLDLNANAAKMPIHLGHLVTHENQASSYLRNLIADIIIPGESGVDILVDFEKNKLGDSYPMSNGGKSTIVNDPDGESGKALRVEGAQTFPQFEITLPEGRTLGEYLTVSIDFLGGGCCGLYGGGMRMAITESIGPITNNDLLNHGYGGPSGFGVADNKWGRGKIVLPLSNMNLSTAQKNLNTFVLTVGSGTGSANYLIDNVTMDWKKPGTVIVKTPQEKADIIKSELEKWITGIASISNDRIQSWSVIYQAIDEENTNKLRSGLSLDPMPENTFYWQDYLGKDYAAIAIGLLKANAKSVGKIYFTETNLVDNPEKIQGLKDLISHTEGKGQQVDGIATELALNVNTMDKAKIETMLQSLAKTGKLIKIAALDIGTGENSAKTTPELYAEQAEAYKWFVETYYRLIPAVQRSGITFRSPVDQGKTSLWRPEEPVGLWSQGGNYLRKSAYEGVVQALEGTK